MTMIKLVFKSVEDCNFFISPKADHWSWLKLWYDAKRVGDKEVIVLEQPIGIWSFEKLISHPGNLKELLRVTRNPDSYLSEPEIIKQLP